MKLRQTENTIWKTNEDWGFERRKGENGRKASTKMAETTSTGPTVMRQVNGDRTRGSEEEPSH